MILLTGATGFIGREILMALKTSYPKTPIVALYYPSFPADFFLGEKVRGVKFVRLDLSSQESWKKLPIGFTHLVHAAAYVPHTPEDFFSSRNFEVNGFGAWNLSRACYQNHALRHVIAISSIAVYGDAKGRFRESKRGRLTDFYGLSKWCMEEILTGLCAIRGIPLTVLRFPSVYGVGQDRRSVLPTFIGRCSKGESLELFEGGRRYQDFLYLRDAVQAVIAAFKKRKPGVFNIGSGKKTTMLRLARSVRKIFGYPSTPIRFTPKKERKASVVFDIRKARKELGYAPRYSLERGLEEYSRLLGRNHA